MGRKKKSFLSDKDIFELERKLERVYRNQSKLFKLTGEYVGATEVGKSITVLTKWLKNADLVLKNDPEDAKQRVEKSDWDVEIIEEVIKLGGSL